MVEFTKRTEVVTEEEVSIRPGTYYFRTNFDDIVKFRKYEVSEDYYKLTIVDPDEGETSIRVIKETWIPDHYTELCFSGHKKCAVSTEQEFEANFNIALSYITAK